MNRRFRSRRSSGVESLTSVLLRGTFDSNQLRLSARPVEQQYTIYHTSETRLVRCVALSFKRTRRVVYKLNIDHVPALNLSRLSHTTANSCMMVRTSIQKNLNSKILHIEYTVKYPIDAVGFYRRNGRASGKVTRESRRTQLPRTLHQSRSCNSTTSRSPSS